MTNTTKTALTAIMAGDCSIPADRAGLALKLLGSDRPLTREETEAIAKRIEGCDELSAIVRTKEVARLFGVDVKTLRNWARRGRLVPVEGGHAGWRVGYTRDSVSALLSGRPMCAM